MLKGDSPNHRASPGVPRWVKMFGIIGIVLALVFVVLHITGRGFGGHRMRGMEHATKPP
jgi:hypothetical protein